MHQNQVHEIYDFFRRYAATELPATATNSVSAVSGKGSDDRSPRYEADSAERVLAANVVGVVETGWLDLSVKHSCFARQCQNYIPLVACPPDVNLMVGHVNHEHIVRILKLHGRVVPARRQLLSTNALPRAEVIRVEQPSWSKNEELRPAEARGTNRSIRHLAPCSSAKIADVNRIRPHGGDDVGRGRNNSYTTASDQPLRSAGRDQQAPLYMSGNVRRRRTTGERVAVALYAVDDSMRPCFQRSQ